MSRSIIVYQCLSCWLTYEHKSNFELHGAKANHPKAQVLRINEDKWLEVKKKYNIEGEKQ